MVNFSTIDTVVLVIYFLFTMGIGFAAIGKASDEEGYTVGGRNMPGWLTGLSILGSYVSSISFLGLTGKAYASNWNAFVFTLSTPIAVFIATKWFIPFYRNIGSVSAYEHLEDRFGTWARVYAGVCYLFTQLARIGAVTYLMALPMNVILGWNIYAIIIITGILVTIYTIFGGIVAVIWTEAIQTVVLILGSIGCVLIMIFAMPEGASQIVSIGIEHNKFSWGSFSFTDLAESTVWITLLYGLFMNLQNFGIDQNYVQRYVSTKSLYEAKKSVWISAYSYIPLAALFFFIGTSLFAFYNINPSLLPKEYAGKPDYVFPFFIVTELPIGARGLLVAAIFAAAMSTISCSLNSSATILLSDYYKRFFNKNATSKQSMLFLKIATTIWGTLGTLFALGFISAYNALDAWWVLAGIFSGGMLGLFLLGIASKNAKGKIPIVSICVGILVILYMTFSKYVSWLPTSPFSPLLIPAFGTTTIFMLGLLLTKILSPNKKS